MSKMDRVINSTKNKQIIYEIYKACRLCGAGAGYKMPIIQDLVDSDVELKQKIRECVQIEVHQDDKMPPLICELCVDKVNDFYEFLEMCRQTNKRTRLRLNLPPQSMPRGAPDAGECILGLTEPVYVNEDSDGEPLAKHKKLQPRVVVKKESNLKVKVEKRGSSDSRPSRRTRRSPTPPRVTRHRMNSKEDNHSLSRLQDKSKSPKGAPKSILKKETKSEDNSLLTPRLKRSRDKEPVKLETPVKKVKIAVKSPPPKSSPKTSPRGKVTKPSKPPKRSTSPVLLHKCSVCGQGHKTPQANSNHMKIHSVTFTSPRMACNPCGAWFPSIDEASAHHRQHRARARAYACRRCAADFRHLTAYDEHFENNQCIPFEEVPDLKCEVCWHLYPTKNLLDKHKCLGEDYRPGGKCSKCNRNYAILRNLKKHEQTCTAKKKGELIVDPVLLGKLRPMQVRVSRCDPLLANIKQEHYDVSAVTADFGLDKNCVYPYISSVSSLRIKSEPGLDKMVAIKEEIKNEFYTEEDYVHWDSEDSSDDEITCSAVLNPFAKKKKVDTLANLTLKTLFSQKCLGKVPRKRRRVKQEKNAFDSLLNETEDDVTRDINNIIDNLGDDDEFGDDKNGKSDENALVSDKIDVTDKSMDVSDDKVGDDDADAKDNDSSVDKSADNVDKESVVARDVEDTSADKVVDNDNSNDISLSNDKNDQINAQNNLSESIDSDVVDKVSIPEEKDINSVTINDNSVCNDVTGSNNNLSSNNDNNDELTRIDDKVTINNGTINNDVEVISKKVTDSKENDVSLSDVSKDEYQNEGNDVTGDVLVKNDDSKIEFESQDSHSTGSHHESLRDTQSDDVNQDEKESTDSNVKGNDVIDDVSAKNDVDESKIDFESQDSNSIGTLHESLLDTQSEDVSENEKESIDKVNIDTNDKATTLPEHNSKIDDNKSQADEFFLDNLSQDSKISDVGVTEFKSNDISNENNDEHTDDRPNNGNDYKNAISVIVNNDKTKKTTDSEELDDTKLMEALDAQIGDSNDTDTTRGQINDTYTDKIALEDLITAKSSDIDIIPDDFNFDA